MARPAETAPPIPPSERPFPLPAQPPSSLDRVTEGRRRVVIEGVRPAVEGGAYPIKRVIGEEVVVEADVFGDGHDLVSCALRFRHEGESTWSESAMTLLGNDRWRGSFTVTELGRYLYTIRGWMDRFGTWRRDLAANAVEDRLGTVVLLNAERRGRPANNAVS